MYIMVSKYMTQQLNKFISQLSLPMFEFRTFFIHSPNRFLLGRITGEDIGLYNLLDQKLSILCKPSTGSLCCVSLDDSPWWSEERGAGELSKRSTHSRRRSDTDFTMLAHGYIVLGVVVGVSSTAS